MSNPFGIEVSSDVKAKHVKLMFYGTWSTRKTETVLRNFPHVLIIDTEGNTDQCIDMPEISKFLRKVTKSASEIKEIIDAVGKGLIKFPDGSLVETVAIDTVSVLWGVQQEVAAESAVKRTLSRNNNTKTADEVNMTQIDWVLAKRPMKAISNRLNGTSVKFFVLIAREKDLYEDGKSENPKKIGVTADVMKGMEFEVNAVLQFSMTSPTTWQYKVTKVQGMLGKTIFPYLSTGTSFPMEALLKYADKLDLTSAKTQEKDDEDIARDQLNQEAPKTMAAFLTWAKTMGVERDNIAPVLRQAGYGTFKPENWEAMKNVVLDHIANASGEPAAAAAVPAETPNEAAVSVEKPTPVDIQQEIPAEA